MSVECLTVNASEAAKLLGVPKLEVYRMVREKDLPHRRFGRRLVFVPKELETFVMRGRRSDEIDAAEAATLLGISRPSVYRMAYRNELPTRTEGNRRFFPRAAVLALIDQPTSHGDELWMEKSNAGNAGTEPSPIRSGSRGR